MTLLRKRLLGLVFFLVVALFLTLTITKFNKTFTEFTDVTLLTDSTGNALPANADVKARGMTVGEVREVVRPRPIEVVQDDLAGDLDQNLLGHGLAQLHAPPVPYQEAKVGNVPVAPVVVNECPWIRCRHVGRLVVALLNWSHHPAKHRSAYKPTHIQLDVRLTRFTLWP